MTGSVGGATSPVAAARRFWHSNEVTDATPTSPFGIRLFRAVWIASLASNVGSLVQSVGASWAMTSSGAPAQLVALVQTANLVPILLLSLWAGALADNVDRRRIVIVAHVFMLAVSAGLAFLAWRGWTPPAVLIGATFLIACGSAINGPAWQASVGDMVPRALLPTAVAYNGISFNLARSAGPALGGLIVAAAGPAAAFLLNACSYVGLIWVLVGWRPRARASALPRERLGSAMITGVRYVELSPPIIRVLVRAALFGAAAGALPALMPLLARDVLGGGALVYGLLLATFGFGAVGGALAGVRLRVARSADFAVAAATVAITVGAAAAGLSHTLALTLPALMVAGAGWVAALSTFNVVVQISSPRWVVARVVALYQMANFGGMALGSWVFGRAAQDHGVETALLAAAALQGLGGLVGWILPMPETSADDLTPASGWDMPEPRLSLDGRTGPIIVEINVAIPDANVAAFLGVMEQRRRNALRNGGQRWTLLRDVADPDRWVERFQFANWLEYNRYHARVTASERQTARQIGPLRTPGTEIRVTRWLQRSTVTPADPATVRATVDPVVPQH